MKIIIEKLNDNAIIPYKPGDETDGAFDLVATSCTLKYNEIGQPRLWYGLGFRTEIPIGYRVMIIPRSSINKKGLRLTNSQGLIDCKYREEWFVIFEPTFDLQRRDIKELENGVLNDIEGIYQIGDRIAQCYLEKIDNTEWVEEVIDLTISRGGGLGSTNNLPRLEIHRDWQEKFAKEALEHTIV
jgi:dUTPase